MVGARDAYASYKNIGWKLTRIASSLGALLMHFYKQDSLIHLRRKRNKEKADGPHGDTRTVLVAQIYLHICVLYHNQ